MPPLIQTRPRGDLDTDLGVSLDPNQSKNFNTPHIRNLKERLRNEINTTRSQEEPTSPMDPRIRISTLADNNNLKDELKDRFCGIEALLGEIETRLGTAQEFEHVGYIQEIAKLTQKTSDINAMG